MERAYKIYESHPPKGTSKKFRNMHCWRILKGQHKWRVFVEKEKNQPEDAAQDPKRPMGKKKAKALQQNKKQRLGEGDDEGEGVSLEVTLLRERLEIDRRRLEEAEKTRQEIQKSREEARKQADEALKEAVRDREIRIMEQDLSKYTGARLRYFQDLQEEIIRKRYRDE